MKKKQVKKKEEKKNEIKNKKRGFAETAMEKKNR